MVGNKGFFVTLFGGILFLVKTLLFLAIGLITLIIGLIVLGISVFLLLSLLNSFIGNNQMPPLVKEANVIMGQEINPDIELFLLTTTPPTMRPTDLNRTTFVTGEAIYPQGNGLKKGDRIAFRVVDGNKVIISLDNYPYYDVLFDGSSGVGTINNEGLNILPGGSYTIQLVKIDVNNTKATIVAKKDFNIISRHSKEFLSRIEFWLSKEDNADAERFQGELNFYGVDQINFVVFGKAPVGEKEVYGRAVMTREYYEGEKFNESPVSDFRFILSSEGYPIKITGMSGHPFPGTYHVRIFVDNELIKEYRVTI